MPLSSAMRVFVGVWRGSQGDDENDVIGLCLSSVESEPPIDVGASAFKNRLLQYLCWSYKVLFKNLTDLILMHTSQNICVLP